MNGDNINPIQVQRYLDGVEYPASKQDLMESARTEGADDSVIQALDSLPDQQFNSPVDVSQALGNMSEPAKENG